LRSEPVEPTLCPSLDGDYALRVPATGRFNRLTDIYQLRLEDESVQPPLGRTQLYAHPIAESQSFFSSDALVLAFENGPKLGLDSALPLMQHLRNALLSRLGPSAPEALTGHDQTGGMSMDAHLSFVPLAFINSRRADGSLKGAALVLPRGATELVRRRLRSCLSELWQLHLGPLGSISVRLIEQASDELASLRFNSYTRACNQWASITPVVLDRHPKKKGLNVETIIAGSCARAGLPPPSEVHVGPISAIAGAPPVREFHGRSKQIDNRIRQHVLLRFSERVRGPVILGAGRFIGLGVCLPFTNASEL
jgi:CRISPR-associated protein Csb2